MRPGQQQPPRLRSPQLGFALQQIDFQGCGLDSGQVELLHPEGQLQEVLRGRLDPNRRTPQQESPEDGEPRDKRPHRERGVLPVSGDDQTFPVVHQQAGHQAAHRVHEERLHRGPTPGPQDRPVHHTHLEGKTGPARPRCGHRWCCCVPAPPPAPTASAPPAPGRHGRKGSSAASDVCTAPRCPPVLQVQVPRTPDSRCRTDCPPADSRQPEPERVQLGAALDPRLWLVPQRTGFRGDTLLDRCGHMAVT